MTGSYNVTWYKFNCLNCKWKSDWFVTSIYNQTTGCCCLHMGGALQLQHLISTLKLQLGTRLGLAIGHKHQGILIHGSTKLSLKFLNCLQSLPKTPVQKVFSYHIYHILRGLPKCNYSHHCLQSINAVMLFVFYMKNIRPKFLPLLHLKIRLQRIFCLLRKYHGFHLWINCRKQ